MTPTYRSPGWPRLGKPLRAPKRSSSTATLRSTFRLPPGTTTRSAGLSFTGGGLLGWLPRDLAGLRAELSSGVSRRLTDTADRLAGRLAESLPQASGCLSETACRLRNRTTWPQRLPGRVGQAAKRLARRAAGTNRLLRRLPDFTESLRHRTAGGECLLAELSNVADRVVHGLHEALEDLGVPVERRQRPVEDVVEVLEANLQFRLRLYALDVDLDLAHGHVDARDHLEQVRELCAQREMRLELLDVDIDLVDFELADVDEDIRAGLGARPSSWALSICFEARLRALLPLPLREFPALRGTLASRPPGQGVEARLRLVELDFRRELVRRERLLPLERFCVPLELWFCLDPLEV